VQKHTKPKPTSYNKTKAVAEGYCCVEFDYGWKVLKRRKLESVRVRARAKVLTVARIGHFSGAWHARACVATGWQC
jgi:hypothetical protein